MSLNYDDCLKRGKIKPFSRGKELSNKELEEAILDFERARKTYSEGDYKWAVIQLYYAMFHSARALLYKENLREHSHFCLLTAIRELYVNKNKLPLHLLEGLQEAKTLREEADYYSRWTKQGCEKLLKIAEEFIDKSKGLIK
ncbi:MAG: hypothetical protein A2539_09365 [Elusimicrobia bacterium RIFOXYD2_FULL_34_15]|nr:MAG: hypothetical protein A2539_09365 [Elusimicrobia bacterium RIFOXYD2_FULL_34_15]